MYNILRLKLQIFGFSSCLLFFVIPSSYALTSQEILERVDKIRAPDKTFTFDVKATVYGADDKLEAILSVRVKDAKKSLVVFKSPHSNKGRTILMVEDNMWIYIPGTSNPLRISPQQQMISRISNADLARVVYNIDYGVEAMEDVDTDGTPSIKMTLTAKTKGAAYKGLILWIERNSFKPIKTEFYAVSGKLLKTAYYKKYREILNKERPTLLEIHDAIKTSEITTLEYENMRIEDTPDAHFQKAFMERAGAFLQ